MVKEYFSHDIDALGDIKIVKMMQDYDYTGFGWYWAIVAELYRNGGRYNFEDLSILAKSTGIKESNLKTFIEKCITKYTHNNKGLFTSDDTGFYSTSLQKRIETREKRANARKVNIDDRVDIDGIKYVNLTAEHLQKIKDKYGEKLANLAILELEKWLIKGKDKLSRTAAQALGKYHFAYFRNDSWVLRNAREELKKTGTNWSI